MTPPTPSAAAPLEVTDETGKTPASSSTHKGSESRSPGRLAWTRFKRDRTGVASAYIVIFFFVIAIAAPLIAKLYGKNPYEQYGQETDGLLNDFAFPVKPNGGIDGSVDLGKRGFRQVKHGLARLRVQDVLFRFRARFETGPNQHRGVHDVLP